MLILVGPSASGKTEAVKILTTKYNLHKLVTYTSRPKRINEIDDVDYHFITKEKFEEKIKQDFFLEYVCYNGFYYGTAYEDLASNKVVILEPSGVMIYKEKAPCLVKICYLKTPIEIRLKRMMARGDDSEQIEKRIKNDDNIFNRKIENVADWVINSEKKSIDDMTDDIYNLYKPFI